MSAKPILFNTDMVRGILDNRKTMTRRVVKGAPNREDLKPCKTMGFGYGLIAPDSTFYQIKPPYRPGDILYVRETWRHQPLKWSREDGYSDFVLQYRADFTGEENDCYGRRGGVTPWKWRPSIHMPREAARIFLRVKDVRVERLHDITITGMQMEGVKQQLRVGSCSCAWKTENCMDRPCPNRDAYEYECWVLPFIEMWDSTISPGLRVLCGWGGNPWVWVIEFERCEKPEEAP